MKRYYSFSLLMEVEITQPGEPSELDDHSAFPHVARRIAVEVMRTLPVKIKAEGVKVKLKGAEVIYRSARIPDPIYRGAARTDSVSRRLLPG